MAGRNKHAESDEAPGAPEWMVTFSDCMTLLLTFFVLLLSFSSFDDKVFRKLDKTFGDALPFVSPLVKRDKDSFFEAVKFVYAEEPDIGSEKPTLQEGRGNNAKRQTEPRNFYDRKVFLVPSSQVFWSRGSTISLSGRRALSNLADFLKQVDNRIVVSETSADTPTLGDELGLARALAIMDYLTTKRGLDENHFNISAAANLSEDNRKAVLSQMPEDNSRILQITLLEQKVYN